MLPNFAETSTTDIIKFTLTHSFVFFLQEREEYVRSQLSAKGLSERDDDGELSKYEHYLQYIITHNQMYMCKNR